jgi:hypothetical protein
MPTNAEVNKEKILRQKRSVGAVAISLLILFSVLAFVVEINWIVWLIADLIVAGIANLIFRRLNREPL